MAQVVKNIGLSLGADICWPLAYEDLLKKLDLSLQIGGDEVRFRAERVVIEPFSLSYKPRYDLVLDRLTHWFHTSREWVKKITMMDGVYVLNNPWSIQSMEKHTAYCAMLKLGLPIPETWLVPPKEYGDEEDMQYTVRHYNRLFDLDQVGQGVGYPAFLKPYDGGGWVGVRRVKDSQSLHEAYDASGGRVHHLQASVEGHDLFVRAIGMGPQVQMVRYDPDAPLHGRYTVDFHFMNAAEWKRAAQITRTINSFFGWDFNSCEMLRLNDVLHPIDFANACPDSQVTSLHFHFPWLLKSMLRWSLFCAATRRPMRLTLDWQRYFDAMDPDATLDENLERYDAIACEHFQVSAFEAFCEEHLGDLDEIALEYFGSERFESVVRAKVQALYPEHEVEQFTQHFFGLIQFWRKTERDRLDHLQRRNSEPEGEPEV